MRTLLALTLFLLPVAALAQVPGQVSYQGLLLKSDGTPETGIAQLTFAIYAADAGGNPLWVEQQAVGLTNGFYAVMLGEKTPFPSSLFDGSARFLEISVGTEVLKPRQTIGSVPYAITAGTAQVAKSVSGGAVDATSLSVKGTPLLDANGQLASTARAGLVDKSALAAQGTINDAANPVDWTQLKNVPSVLATGSVLAQVEHDATLSGRGTTASQLAVDLSKVQARVTGRCGTDTFVTDVNADGTVICAGAPLVSYSAGAGLSLNGSTFSLKTGCNPGEVLKWNGNTWACGADLNPTYSAGSGLALNGSTFSVAPAVGAFAVGASGSVTYPGGTQTLVKFALKDFDVSNWFDTVNFRFVPQQKGIYFFSVGLKLETSTAGAYYALKLRKNGAEVRTGAHRGGSTSDGLYNFGLLQANGTTDYFDVILENQGANTVISSAAFEGHLVSVLP